MTYSMTAYAQAKRLTDYGELSCELRAVNHRYLEVQPRMPEELRPLEQAAFQPYGSRKLEPVAVHEWDVKFKPGLRAQAEEAVKASLWKSHALPSLDEALASMKLVQKIYA